MLRLALGAAAAFAWATVITVAARSTVAAVSARPAIPVASVTPRATVAVTAVPSAIAAISAVASRLTRLARRAGVGELLAGFLVDQAHRQADLAARVDLEELDLHFLAFGQDVADVLDPLVLDLRNVHQPVLAGHEGHERAEIDDARHLAGVDGAGLRLGDDAADPVARRLDPRDVAAGDLDHALVVNVALGAGRRDDLADDLAAGPDDFADLVLGDGHGLDARRVSRKLLARVIERLGHLAEDMGATFLRLGEGGLHDLLGDAGDLDVHLKAGDALGRAGDLEVHVAEVILVAEDVGDHCIVLALEDQTHGDARDGAL